jgi:hypothetical protein
MGLAVSAHRSSVDGLDAVFLLVYENSGFASLSFVDFLRTPIDYRDKRLVVVEPRHPIVMPTTNTHSSMAKLPFDATVAAIRSTFTFRLVQSKTYRLWVAATSDAQYTAFVRQIRQVRFAQFRASEVVPASQILDTSRPLRSVCDALSDSASPTTFNGSIRVPTSVPAIVPLSNACDLIVPGIYVGGESACVNTELLNGLGVTHVVTMGSAALTVVAPSIRKYEITLADGPFEELPAQFWNAVQFIGDAIDERGVVLIHCRKGISRSPALCIAYLMIRRGYSFENALKLITQKRPSVALNPGFMQQLRRREQEIQIKIGGPEELLVDCPFRVRAI